MVVKNINSFFENRIVDLEKQFSKNEQNDGRINVEISRVSNDIPGQNLQESIIKMFKDMDINILHVDIEGCHRLPLGKNMTNTTKRVIAKFVNKKHSKAIFQRKKKFILKVRFL